MNSKVFLFVVFSVFHCGVYCEQKSSSTLNDLYQQLIKEWSRNSGHTASLPILIVPVPVHSDGNANSCSSQSSDPQNSFNMGEELLKNGPYMYEPPQETFQERILLPTASSEELLQLFQLQSPSAPYLPPALLESRPSSPLRRRSAPPSPFHLITTSSAEGEAPPPLVFSRSLTFKAELTVPRADYTQVHTVRWDANSGAASTFYYSGTTMTFRQQTGDALQTIEARVDNVVDPPALRCRVAPPQRHYHAPAAPGLPDTSILQFYGYRDFEDKRVELWKGETKEEGSQGEQLLFKHEVLVTRTENMEPLPIKYSVRVDSSILGPNADGWEHRYTDFHYEDVDPQTIHFDYESQCTDIEKKTDASDVDALHPFIHPQPNKDKIMFIKFKKDYNRKYADNTEEAIRMNLHTQIIRFTSSLNRQGAKFETGVNFLADRLDSELSALLGVRVENSQMDKQEQFPHSKEEVDHLEKKQPEAFDWRDEGGVSPVRYQGSCSSCWAAATTAATEGALFRVTRKLTPLADQVLVDCGHKYGANGCMGTWPSHAYDYIQAIGLPALDEYGNLKEIVEQCRDNRFSPVTKISGHVNVTSHSVAALKVAIYEHAPTVVIIDATAKSFIYYKTGILEDQRCGKTARRLNHAVAAVGFGASFVAAKNSWSAAWGEQGYIRLRVQTNTCGLLTLPSYPRLELNDVLRQR